MKTIILFEFTGDFAENKDIARDLRLKKIEPSLKKGISLIIDFNGVTSATQSFIHALISETIRVFGVEVLNQVAFKNCSDRIKTIIEIVVEYVQDGLHQLPEDAEQDNSEVNDPKPNESKQGQLF